MNVRFSRLGFILLVVVSACGYEIPSQSQLSSQERPIPILLFSGGYASCAKKAKDNRWEMGEAAKIEKMWEAAGLSKVSSQKIRGVSPVTIFTCYSALDKYSFFDSFNLRYSHDPKFEKYSQIDLSESELISNHFLADYFAYVKKVVDETRKKGPVELYIMGHSYGAWTAIHTAHHFHEYVEVAGLVTMDPISVLKCKASDMITQPISTLIQDHPGCLESPTDRITLEAIQNLVNHPTMSPKFWLNVYQNAFRFLHSDGIKELDGFSVGENWEYNYTPENGPPARFGFFRNYHSYLGRDPIVWQDIREKYFSFIN